MAINNNNFNRLVRPLNIKYRDVFGHIPRITDYSCTREEYLDAMEKAIESKRQLSAFLVQREGRYKAGADHQEE